MKTITIANNKGGVGKSTLSVLFAHYLKNKKARVLVSDWDDQSNLSSTLQGGRSGFFDISLEGFLNSPESVIDLPYPHILLSSSTALVGLSEDQLNLLPQAFGVVSERFDYHIIDLPPSASQRMFVGLTLTNDIFCPIGQGEYSIDSANRFLGFLETLDVSKNFRGFIFNKCRGQNKKELNALKNELGDMCLCTLGERKKIQEAISKEASGLINFTSSGSDRNVKKEVENALDSIFNAIS